jgi:hypothetical protein
MNKFRTPTSSIFVVSSRNYRVRENSGVVVVEVDGVTGIPAEPVFGEMSVGEKHATGVLCKVILDAYY